MPKPPAQGKSSSSSGRLDVIGALKRKLGPLPAWAWLGLVAVAIFAFYRWRKGSTSSATTSTVPADPGTGGGGYDGGGGGGIGGGPAPDPGPTPPYPQPAPTVIPPSTNAAAGTSSSPASNPQASTAAKQKLNAGRATWDAGQNRQTIAPVTPQVRQGILGAQAQPGGIQQMPPPMPSVERGLNSIPSNARNVHVLASGAVTYESPSGATIEQPVSGSRYVIKKAPARK